MAIKPLSLESLGEVGDGGAKLIIDNEIAVAVRDTDDRGEDGKPRKVVIEVTLEKQDSGLVEVSVFAQAKLPPRRTHATVTRPKNREGKVALMFSQFAQDDPDQRTIDLPDGEIK